MAFAARRLLLADFRNRPRLEVEFSDALTVLVGPNAAGKTNTIEALQLTTAARSFRRASTDELVREGCGRARIELMASDERKHLTVRLDLERGARRAYTVNGAQGKRASEVRGRLTSVVFTPGDLDLVKGSSEVRRTAVDEIGEQLSPAYDAARKEYAGVLKQRNRLLKDGGNAALFEALDEQLAVAGARLTTSRARLTQRIALHAAAAYENITGGETMRAEFLPSWKRDAREAGDTDPAREDSVRARIVRETERLRAEERARMTTLVGPHRDDVEITVAGRSARTLASQGQQRTAALAWKLAEVVVITEISGSRPLLLLDDVMSELDENRRSAMASLVSERVQTIITTTNPRYFESALLGRAHVVELAHG